MTQVSAVLGFHVHESLIRCDWSIACLILVLCFIEFSPAASTSTTNLIVNGNGTNGTIPHVSSENHFGFRHRVDVERETESSDDEVKLVKRSGCNGSKDGIQGGGGCCSAQSPIKTVVDIEDILVRKSINQDPHTDG